MLVEWNHLVQARFSCHQLDVKEGAGGTQKLSVRGGHLFPVLPLVCPSQALPTALSGSYDPAQLLESRSLH